HQPLGAGMAERAIERAADLARYAKGASPCLRYVDTFHFMRPLIFSRQPQQPFSRAVDRHLLSDDLWPRDGEPVFKRGAQLLGYAGHGVERGGAADVEPMPKLLAAHFALCRRHANLAKRRRKLRTRPADERGPVRIHIALQRRLLDKSGGGRGFKVDAHDTPCRRNEVAANTKANSRSD